MTLAPARPERGPTTGPRSRTPLATAALVAAVVLAVAGSVTIGSRVVPLDAVLDPDHVLRAVVDARIGRTLLALAVGAALGLAGTCMQGLTRNPLADPGILGINAGACLAMVLALSLLGVSELSSYVWFSFLGAAVAAVLVHVVASLGREGATPVKLAIAGAAVTAAVSSWTAGILLIDRNTMETFRFWQVGTVGGRDLEVLALGLPFLAVGALMAISGARVLDALALGDDLARALGRRTLVDRVVIGIAIVLLAGTATALAGPIAFVGLMAPHGVRAIVGNSHVVLLPLSAMAGAALVVVADTIGRIVLPPSEVQVGIMTAVVGVPVFLALVRRGRAVTL